MHSQRTRPRVAIIGTRGYPSYYGGFETAVRHLAPHLASHGWEVIVYGRGPRGADATTSTEGIRSVNTAGVESRSLSTLSYGLTSSFHAVFKARPDVALVMNVANGFWLPLLRAARIPTLVNVDGIEWERAKWGTAAQTVFKLGARITARFASDLVFDARAIGEYWQRVFGRAGRFIPYGGAEIPPQAPPLGLQRRGYVLYVARFVPENSILEFLMAAPDIAAHLPVVVVGSSGYGGAIDAEADRLAKANDGIRWLGHVSDDSLLHSLWQNAAVYFHGHTVGGTNPALVQAMAAGAPTVAVDTVYNKEVLGDHAVFVSRDSSEIAGAICALAADPARLEALSRSALDRAREHYSWQSVCAAYEDALSELKNDEGAR